MPKRYFYTFVFIVFMKQKLQVANTDKDSQSNTLMNKKYTN